MTAQSEYPPPPWLLNATAYISIWRIPKEDLAFTLGSTLRPIQIGRRLLVAAGFVAYDRGSDLEYNELFLAALTRAKDHTGITIPMIWVDSPLSLRAGRELWGIPKELASFNRCGEIACLAATSATGQTIAELRFRKGWALPFRIPLQVTVLQEVSRAVCRTRIEASTSIELGSADWMLPGDSPLRLLRGRRPVISMKLRNARIRFGA